ncbi:MAG: RHS repeat-associated core domain-containing protein [Candidatus Thermoplasmatota archaeon]|nr:RHS repeat-associated core domain-containing protein [Candidatus Thermoplasmatota archaeon]
MVEEYWYGHDGQRVKKLTVLGGGINVSTFYIGKDYETKVYSNGTLLNTTYYYALGELVGRNDNDGSMYYYHNDHLRGTHVVTNSSGDVAEISRYYPFGSILHGGESQYEYTGKERDEETGQLYLGARYFNPKIKRWMQPDNVIPGINNPQALNRYSYNYNNPLIYIDPTGEYPNKVEAVNPSDVIDYLVSIESSCGDCSVKQVLHEAAGQINRYEKTSGSGIIYPGSTTHRPMYVHTIKYGWVDVMHLLTSAELSAYTNEGITMIGGYLVEIAQLGKSWHSAFSYEDLPSDLAGSEFGTYIKAHEGEGKTGSELLKEFLVESGATEKMAEGSNYNNLPYEDPRNPLQWWRAKKFTHFGIKYADSKKNEQKKNEFSQRYPWLPV